MISAGIRTIPSWRLQEIERYSQVRVEDAACTGETRTEREHKDGCGECAACKQVDSLNHPDVIYITNEKYEIRVDDIRKGINETIDIKPYSGDYKIYIIDDADRMNAGAQNALLKTLEEPPAYAVILLLTNN